MARGWESKSVESQQIEERPEGYVARERNDDASRERREAAGKRAGLELSRQRIQRELASTRSDVHRTALEHALRHLEGELGKLR